MTDTSEIILAIREASKRRKKITRVQRVLDNIDEYAKALKDKIESGNWSPPKHEEVMLQEGYHKKARNIQKPRWDDEQIVHHMLMRQYIPIMEPKIHEYCCGSIKKKGTHFLCKKMRSWVRGYGSKRFYVAELDIKKFYDNIDLVILKKQLSKIFRDKKYLNLLFMVIGDGEKGIPKGFYTSPWLAHTYLLPMDNYILQMLKPDHYARYMDNIWIFSPNKRELHKMVKSLFVFVDENLKLEFNDNWQIFRFEDAKLTTCKDGKARHNGRAIDCVGFVIHRFHIGLRKGIIKRIRAKVNRIKRLKRLTIFDCKSLLSRLGYFKYADVYGYYLEHIKPKISIRYMKKRVSDYDKKQLMIERRLTA